MKNLWSNHGLPTGYPSVTYGMPVAYPRATQGRPMGCPWASHSLPMGYLKDTMERPLTTHELPVG